MDTVYPFIPMYPNGSPRATSWSTASPLPSLSPNALLPPPPGTNGSDTSRSWLPPPVFSTFTPLLHLPFHPRQGYGTLHGGRIFRSSLSPDPVRTGILLVPYRPPTPACRGGPTGVLHCPGKRQGRRARPGLLPAGGKHACRQGRRNRPDSGQPVPGGGRRRFVEQFGRGRRFV